MNKTAVILTIVAIAVASYVLLFRANEAQAPIVDEVCQAGYIRLGEGCVPLKEACEAGGDDYYFDESLQECLRR